MPPDAQPVQQLLDQRAADHREREHGERGEEAPRRPQRPARGVRRPVGQQHEARVPRQGVERQRADGLLHHVPGARRINQPPPLVRRQLARGGNEARPAGARRDVDRGDAAQHRRQQSDGGEGEPDGHGVLVAPFGEDGADRRDGAVTPDEARRQHHREGTPDPGKQRNEDGAREQQRETELADPGRQVVEERVPDAPKHLREPGPLRTPPHEERGEQQHHQLARIPRHDRRPGGVPREREEVQSLGSRRQSDQPRQDRRRHEQRLEQADPRPQEVRDDQQAGDQSEVQEHGAVSLRARGFPDLDREPLRRE